MSNGADDNMKPLVYVVDDDVDYCEWLTAVLQTIEVPVKSYHVPSAFLAEVRADRLGCIILDVRLPEMSGKQVYQELLQRGLQIPVIMITGYGEVSDAVDAIKSGAIDYVQKPISPQALLDRVQRALALSRERLSLEIDLLHFTNLFDTLSPRESEVMELLVDGLTTKQIAGRLGIGLTTVDFHRHNLLEKMQVENLVELTHMMDQFERLRAQVKPSR